MTSKRWALFFGLASATVFSLPAAAEDSYWTPRPSLMFLAEFTGYEATYTSSHFYRATGEACSRSWADSCDVWIAETGGEVLDLRNMEAYVLWDNHYIVDYDVYYYDLEPRFCYGSGCEAGQWSSPDYEGVWGDYFVMRESGIDSHDYDEAMPLIRYDFVLRYVYGGYVYEWTKALEIWTDDAS